MVGKQLHQRTAANSPFVRMNVRIRLVLMSLFGDDDVVVGGVA